MKTQPKTVADRESATGKPDSIRNPTGTNARSDQKLTTLQKKYVGLIAKLQLPEQLPYAITIHYDDKDIEVDPRKLNQLSAFARMIGIIS